MPDDGFIPIDDFRISEDIRESVRAQIYDLVRAHYNLTAASDTKWSISALQRVLYGINAIVAEESWYDVKEQSAHPDGIRIEVRLDSTGFPDKFQYGRRPEKWFLSHDLSGGTAYYIQISDDSGRTAHKVRPPGLRDENIIELRHPSESPITLRSFLEKLTSQLDSSSNDDIPFITAQKNRRSSLLLMYSPDRATVLNFALADTFSGILRNLSNYSFEAPISKILSDHKNFLTDGDLGGQLLLIICALKFASMSPRNRESIDSSFASSTAPLFDILKYITEHKDGKAWIQAACEEMQEHGEKLQIAALDADSVGLFYGSIYTSIPWLWGAYLGFRYLSQAPKSEQVPSHKISANVCDERIANACPSLLTAFLDTLDGRSFRATRDLIIRKRRTEGDEAAEALADHFIEVMLEYPRYFKPLLLGQEDRYRVHKP